MITAMKLRAYNNPQFLLSYGPFNRHFCNLCCTLQQFFSCKTAASNHTCKKAVTSAQYCSMFSEQPCKFVSCLKCIPKPCYTAVINHAGLPLKFTHTLIYLKLQLEHDQSCIKRKVLQKSYAFTKQATFSEIK